MKYIKGLRAIAPIGFLCLALSLSACSASPDPQTLKETDPVPSQPDLTTFAITQDDNSNKGDYENLVINDLPIEDSEFIIENDNDSSYILLSDKIITYALKLPDSTDYYPELSLENGQISMTWRRDGQPLLKVDMVEGSHEAYLNDSNEPIDIKVAPKSVDGHLYIPINLMLSGLKMKETYDKDLHTTFIHYERDFSKSDLVGCWSDSGTDSFKDYKNAINGNGSLASFVTCYQFNEDGTYQVLLIGVGGFDDKLIMAKGKYTLLGNTIIYQGIEETLYEGNPLELVHENKLLDHAVYEFIDEFDKTSGQISINGFFLNRVAP